MPKQEAKQDTDPYYGQCQCGAVKFCITPPTSFCSHCHCYYCQQSHGAAFVTWVGSYEDKVDIQVSTNAKVQWYQSSEFSQRGFCSNCGSRMFFKSSMCPGELHVARALIAGDIDRQPEQHDFYDQSPKWYIAKDHLPAVMTTDEALARYKQIPNGK